MGDPIGRRRPGGDETTTSRGSRGINAITQGVAKGDDGNRVGVYGASESNSGVSGISKTADGVRGLSTSGDGVYGSGHRGVVGESKTFQGVYGKSRDNAGVVGESDKMHAVYGISHNRNGAGVYATNDKGGFGVQADCPNGIGILAKGGDLAGRFEGSVEVTGDVDVTGDIRLANADCAEDFDIADPELADPGTVMVLDDEGTLRTSHRAYDRRVAGVLSGAGTYRPGLVLDRQSARPHRKPVALLGKTYCKVDASKAPIEVGDLLTTSSLPGHAMKATDANQAFGAVIGKALRSHRSGTGLIPILIALQ